METLRLAQDQVASAGDVAARFVEREADTAPEKSSWLDAVGDRAREAGADLVNGVASFGNAMLQNPGETATLAGGILLTAVSVTGDGLGVAMSATGAGAVAGVPLSAVSAAGVVAGAGLTAAATASLMQHAAHEDAVSPVSGSAPTRPVPTKTDRMKEHLTEKDLDAAHQSELSEASRLLDHSEQYVPRVFP